MTWQHRGSLPWQTDRPLTVDQAGAIIRACFPHIDTAALQHFGYGWEFDAFLTADRWLFRFPRRADWADGFERESRVLRLVRPALPAHVAVPHVELFGEPTLAFPYAFAGHRFIEGVDADAIADDLLPTCARDIAAFLGTLHSIPQAEGRAAGLREMDDQHEKSAREWSTQVLAGAERLRGMDPVVDSALAALSRESFPADFFRVPLQVIHADLSADHVIVDRDTGHIRGVIDWTDAMLGDPARDFVFLAFWRGWSFVEEVLSHYPRPVNAGFRGRIRSMARLISLFTLDVACQTDRDVAKHLQAVRNVFVPEQ